MLKKTLPGWEFFLPLSVHSGVHASFSLLILMVVAPHLWWLFLVDFVIHFIMDRIKAGPKYLGRFNNRDKHSFWICFGLDQMVHHLTHYFIVYTIVVDRFFKL